MNFAPQLKNPYGEVFRNDKHFSKKIGAVQAYIQHNCDFWPKTNETNYKLKVANQSHKWTHTEGDQEPSLFGNHDIQTETKPKQKNGPAINQAEQKPNRKNRTGDWTKPKK